MAGSAREGAIPIAFSSFLLLLESSVVCSVTFSPPIGN